MLRVYEDPDPALTGKLALPGALTVIWSPAVSCRTKLVPLRSPVTATATFAGVGPVLVPPPLFEVLPPVEPPPQPNKVNAAAASAVFLSCRTGIVVNWPTSNW